MNFLPDTHTILWFLDGNQSLSPKARAATETDSTTKFISIASIWEIAIKRGLGKIGSEITLKELMQAI